MAGTEGVFAQQSRMLERHLHQIEAMKLECLGLLDKPPNGDAQLSASANNEMLQHNDDLKRLEIKVNNLLHLFGQMERVYYIRHGKDGNGR